MAIENIEQAHTAVKLEIDKMGSLETLNVEPEDIDYALNKALTRWYKNRMSGVNPKKESVEQTQKRIDDLRVFVEEVELTAASVSGSDNKYEVSLPSDYWFTLGEEVDITITSPDCTLDSNTKRQGITEVTSDTYQYELQNPYSDYRLYLNEAKPLRLYKGNYIQLVSDGNYTIDTVYLRYLKAPKKLSYYTNRITSGNIEAGVTYKVLDGTITYDGTTGITGTFPGVNNEDSFIVTAERGIVAEYRDFEIPSHARDEIITIAVNIILKTLGDPRSQLQESQLFDME